MPEKPEPFLAIKFTGGRYKHGGLDSDALKSIIAIEKAIQEIAVSLWKKDNPGKRLPNGFREAMKNMMRITSITNEDEDEKEIKNNS